MLSREEHRRYSRQLILPEMGLTGQLKLKSGKVLVIGAGGLGCPILQYLTAAGIGEIGIIDDDLVELSNLHRQILYTSADLGKAKVAVAKEKLAQLNPHVKITAYHERLTADNALGILGNYPIIVDGSDNFKTRYLVNDVCIKLGKTLVFGSLFKFEGQISVFNHLSGPDYRTLFREPPVSNEAPNCTEIGVLNILPGIVGMYMANEVIKILCEIGETLSGILMTINALDNTTLYFKIPNTKKPTMRFEQSQTGAVEEVDLPTLKEWLINPEEPITLVDVREEYEYEEYNIGGINIPLYELVEKWNSLPKKNTVVFICQTGQKSKMAIQLIKSMHNGLLYSLKHGIRYDR